MDDERPLDGGHHNGSLDSGDIDQRPSWILAIAGVLVALVVVVSVATRNNQSTDDEVSLPAPTEPESGPTSVSPALSEETGSDSIVDPDLGQLPLSEAVSASLPAGGIDGWVFSLDGLSRLTRTDLTTGEESRISLRDEQRSEFEFILSQSRLVQIGNKVVWAGPDVLYLVNIETMEVTSVGHLNGPAVMVANDDDTVWLSAFMISLGHLWCSASTSRLSTWVNRSA